MTTLHVGGRSESSLYDACTHCFNAVPSHAARFRIFWQVRHGQSLGNVDPAVYETIPDHRLPLTEKGKAQAIAAGRGVASVVGQSKVCAYVSPYARSVQTFQHMLMELEHGQVVRARMEPRVREQDFGNFQDSEVMSKSKELRNKFGRFYYRFPNGESGADVYDRVTTVRATHCRAVSLSHPLTVRALPQFLDTLHREWEKPPSRKHERYDTVLVVTHGLTMRLLLMRWFRWSVETFERTKNPGNCEFVVMERTDGGQYILAEPSPHIIGLTHEQCRYGAWHV